MNREDKIADYMKRGEPIGARIIEPDLDWLVRVVRAARKLRDAVLLRPDDVVPTPPDSDLAKAMGGPFGDLSILLHEES